MGKIKTGAAVAAGLALMGSMAPNAAAGEVSGVGAALLLTGFGLVCLPFALPALHAVLERRQPGLYRRVLRAAGALLAAALVGMAAMTAAMLGAAARDTAAPADAAVIVPGTGLQGVRPGEMLKSRLDTAAGYLRAHPSAVCVVTGGLYGSHTQGQVMRDYLTAKGIAPGRILTDEEAQTTYENFLYARRLLPRQKDIVIVTDAFHQLRAKFLAARFGFAPYTLCSPTPLRHLPDAWLREYGALVKNFFLYQLPRP